MLRSTSLRSIFILTAVAAVWSGCLSDPTDILQVRPETVLAPGNPSFRAVNYVQYSSPPSGQLLVKWNRSVADTQLNFKGYFVRLYTSHPDAILQTEVLDSLVDTASIFRKQGAIADTFVLLKTVELPSILTHTSNVPIPFGRYSVVVHGIKTSSGDTIIYSKDSAVYSALYTPLPLQNPTNLRATSVSPTQVALRWTAPVTAHDTGFWQYVIYYRDTTKFNDTAHFAGSILKGTPNDTTQTVNVPGSNIAGSTTPEWPYEFWIKSERIDLTFFYGPDMYGPDTNSITWAGAENVPKSNFDSTRTGYLLVPADSSIYFGSFNNQYDVAINRTGTSGQMSVTISNGIVTLHAQGPNGVGFYNGTPEIASGLDSIFYSVPHASPTQFTNSSIDLPRSVSDTNSGVVVYLMMNDDINKQLGHEFARIFIRAQPDGTFINGKNPLHAPNGGIDIQASFQPGVTLSGSEHLHYY